ncbi:hypothetical protein D3C78_590910 [compost metagenome]
MHALDFRRLQNQLRQLFAVAIVVAHDDVIDDFSKRDGTPVFVDGLLGQLRQFSFNRVNIQLLSQSRACQRLLTAAAVIHVVFTKQRRCARNGERQLA